MAAERRRIEVGGHKEEGEVDDLLTVNGLTRVFAGLMKRKDVVAVNNVSVGVRPGEVSDLECIKVTSRL